MIRRVRGVAFIVLVCVVAGCAASEPASSSRGTHAYRGHRWRITEVKGLRSPTYDMRLPASDHAWIAFDHAHRLTAYDLIQRYTLSYRATMDGFLPRGYRGTAAWTASSTSRRARVSTAVTAVLGDRFHPVRVDRLSDRSITLTAFFHNSASDPNWHPVVQLICSRDDSAA